jgi:predicted SnoaL-like aldol condensation-catalyzing enzyme
MAETEVQKASTVFEGIATRNAELAIRYINPVKFMEHNPRIADGAEGFREFVRQLSSEDHLKITRIYQDGPYVFAQTEGSVLGRNIFFDIFRFQDGLIVEHWTFSALDAPPNQSGHTQTDGPTEARDIDQTEANKAIVKDYYQTIHVSGNHLRIPEFFRGDACIRHEPGVRDGVGAFERDLERLIQNRSIDEIKLVLGQGDFVFIAAMGSVNGDPCAYIDLYRVEAGKIAERWGLPEQTPPREEWRNDNRPL